MALAQRADPAPPPVLEEPSAILVVDDNEANRDTLSRRLARKGYKVSLARDGSEALAILGEQRFDLVLLDVMMPGLSGLEVLERLRRSNTPAELPVIMATARDESADIVNAFNLGASDYVIKPLDFPVVLARVRTHLALKHAMAEVRELKRRLASRNAELEAAAERTRLDLRAAALVQESSLPNPTPRITGMRFSWRFQPCEALAGDSLNICPLDVEHVGAYVLDVSGHGVAAALLAVAATRVLSAASDAQSLLVHHTHDAAEGTPVSPAEVADQLNRKFAWDDGTQQFLTLFYTLLNVRTGRCRYVSAGHPGAVHVTCHSPPAILPGEGSCLPIGLGDGYHEHTVQLLPGERLYLYSDGVTEAMNPQRDPFGRERLLDTLGQGRSLSLDQSVELVTETVRTWCGHAPGDDISVLAIERE